MPKMREGSMFSGKQNKKTYQQSNILPLVWWKKRHTSVCHAKNNQIFRTLCWKSCENCWNVMRYTKILPKNEITGKQINIFPKFADSNKKGNRSACESYKLSLTHSEVCVCVLFLHDLLKDCRIDFSTLFHHFCLFLLVFFVFIGYYITV